ncbi:MAG: hypothetical protein ACOX7X_11115 [Methanosarcina flavescens]|uniref:hypothetical protein n=1 Tax=Methanosarcina flavescens TaxID=1715806 RepID=UPI0014355D8A|nr:hypothetical protein [Methanosarcina flavescens]
MSLARVASRVPIGSALPISLPEFRLARIAPQEYAPNCASGSQKIRDFLGVAI